MTTLESKLWQRELRVACELAQQAGVLAMGYRDGDLQVEMKPGDEPVSAADRAASELITQGLRRAFPEDVVISEESADDLNRLTAERVWYVDPIDGTKDFIRGDEGFCVMIGLAVDFKPVVGALYQPVAKGLFRAAPDIGAWFSAPNKEPKRLRCSQLTDIAGIRLVASKSHRDHTIDQVKSALGISTEFNIGSVGLKLGLIALGERDLYVNPSSNCKTWDTCGPEAVLTAAGGRLTDLCGKALRYDIQDSIRRDGMVASNGLLHDQVIERLRGTLGV